MNHYLSMEYLKLRHSHINWVVAARVSGKQRPSGDFPK